MTAAAVAVVAVVVVDPCEKKFHSSSFEPVLSSGILTGDMCCTPGQLPLRQFGLFCNCPYV